MSRKNRGIPQLLLILLLAVCVATPCSAQERSEWEFFGGYSFKKAEVREYFRSTPIIYSPRNRDRSLNGWSASVTENLNDWIGGTLDISGHSDSRVELGVTNRQRMYSIMYGPRISYRRSWSTPFVHVLLGVAHSDVRVTPVGPHASDFAFAAAAGGGLDVRILDHVSLRVFQVEYFRAEPLGTNPNRVRASAGVVFSVGRR